MIWKSSSILQGNCKWHRGVLCLLSLRSLQRTYILFTRQAIYKCQTLQILAGRIPGNISTAETAHVDQLCTGLPILHTHPLLIPHSHVCTGSWDLAVCSPDSPNAVLWTALLLASLPLFPDLPSVPSLLMHLLRHFWLLILLDPVHSSLCQSWCPRTGCSSGARDSMDSISVTPCDAGEVEYGLRSVTRHFRQASWLPWRSFSSGSQSRQPREGWCSTGCCGSLGPGWLCIKRVYHCSQWCGEGTWVWQPCILSVKKQTLLWNRDC